MKLQNLFQKIYYYGYESLDTGKEVSLFQYYDDSISLANIRHNLFCNRYLKQDILSKIEIEYTVNKSLDYTVLQFNNLGKLA